MTLTISLPDGSTKKYPNPITVAELAADIGSGLLRAAGAAKVNNHLVDLSYLLSKSSDVRILTDKDPEMLEIIRHSCAHLLAHAIKTLYPEAQITIGPVIENGFYYDIAYREPFTEGDLTKIEAEMRRLAKQKLPLKRIVMARNDAVQLFRKQQEEYKAKIIEEIPEGENISLYQQGDFTDLCRGPHVPHTGKLKAFKLTKVAGAYWRGNSENEMLQRIYGTAWQNKEELTQYLERLAEAEKRDHRRLGKKLDLFHFQPEAPGMVFWHERGWKIFRSIEEFMRSTLERHGYHEVHTPQMLDRDLWERSGHWEKFSELMFTTESERRTYAIKPMNCPAHIQIYNQGLKSYRDLPYRLAEFGVVHRNEHSGTLHGLLRARRFTQDDAHIFCTDEQIGTEVSTLIQLTLHIYKVFGFKEIMIALSTRPPKRIGSDDLWDRAEQALKDAILSLGINFTLQDGEGAFYGPKIEFVLQDCLQRRWQCGTIQLDFSMPKQLNATYVAADGTKQTPVLIHRAILGSIERFIGILIEHYAGALPLWLAPVQVVVLSLSEKQVNYAMEIADTLTQSGIRTSCDLRNETISYKIREQVMARIPYIIVVGAKEMQNKSISLRKRDEKEIEGVDLLVFLREIKESLHQQHTAFCAANQ